MIRKISREPGKFLNNLDIFWMFWKVFRQPGKFQDSQDSLQMVPKISGQPGYSPDSPDSFQIAWKISRQHGKFLNSLDIFGMVLNLFDNPEFFLIILKVSRQSSIILDGETISHVFFQCFLYFFRRENVSLTLFCRKYNQRSFLLQNLFEHTCVVAQTIYTHFFCHKNYSFTFLSKKKNLCILAYVLPPTFSWSSG